MSSDTPSVRKRTRSSSLKEIDFLAKSGRLPTRSQSPTSDETQSPRESATSVKGEVSPHTTGKDTGEDKANTASRATEKAPLSKTKNDKPAQETEVQLTRVVGQKCLGGPVACWQLDRMELSRTMSSDTPPARKRPRSSRKLALSQTQPPTSDESQSSLENLALSTGPTSLKEIVGESTNEPQREEKSVQAGLGTKPLDDTEVEDTDAVPSASTSAKEVSPQATDKDEGEDELGADTGMEGRNQRDGMKTDKPTGNKGAANGESDPKQPTLEKSWDVVMTEVTSLDEGLVGGWKEDIDTLLVFAGLFSAVVTAFTIESYQWLQEAPEDTTVALLKQISQQLNGSSVTETDEFTVSSSDVAINILWFLSLILALVDALFALLCKQWLREHRRHTHTRTPSEALALRWHRNQSLEKWRVPMILASLPMLLEFALFLFLAGLLELLRTRQPVLFKISTAVVAFAALFYFGTTIIPTVDVIRQARQVTWELREMRTRTEHSKDYLSPVDFITTLPPMEYTCPYKSPQAWAAFQVLRLISHILSPLRRVALFLYYRDWITNSAYHNFIRPTLAFGEIINSLSDWSSVDLELLQRSSIDLAPPFYELDAFRWLVAELRDSPHMIPHLRNILSTFPLHLVMPAVLDQWFFLPGRKWTVGDIEAALDPNLSSEGIEDHLTRAKRDFLAVERRTGHFKHLLHWTHVSMNGGSGSGRDSTPFECIDAIPDDDLVCDHLWGIYTEMAQSLAASDYYLATLMQDLASHIIASSPNDTLNLPTTTTSMLVKSAAGRNFLSHMHRTILERAIYNHITYNNQYNWMEAMDIVRRVHELPEDHFGVIPGHFSLPLSKLRKMLNGLSPTDPEIGFGYLGSLSRDWGGALNMYKEQLVEILSKHINEYPQSDAESSHCPGESKISPLVMSSAGLGLITFVHNRLAEERETYRYLSSFEGRTSDWRDAIERVGAAHPDLPPDHFTDIFHEYIDPPAPRERLPQLGAEVEAQAEDSGGSPRDVTDTGEVDPDEPMEGCSGLKPFPQPKPEGLVEDTEQGNIPMQPVATENPASCSASGPVQGTVMGGPDADKNV
ncbi:hypothetical protein PM082_011074 [Marasmius tenuissimus]|nr:hypothetical protein PM082_011074 [Marasmius tenuissimus]